MNAITCNWDSAKFFFFSENVFDPLIYYSHLGPVMLSLALLVLIYFGNRKELLNKILMGLIVFFCIWALSDLILWATEKSDLIMFFWSLMIFFELLIYATAFYFFHVFIYKKDIKLWGKLLLVLPFIPLFLFVASPYNLVYFDLTNCDREAVEGALWNYTYIMEIVFTFLIFIWTLLGLLKAKKEGESLKRMLLVASGIILFLIAFSWGNIAGSISEDWSIGQYGLFGLPVFIGFLAYAIVKYQILNIRILAVQMLVSAIAILIGAQFFFIRSTLNQVLTIITLFLILTFGGMLIKSIKKEIQRKEELQEMSDRLARANDELRKLDNAKSEFISIASHQLRTPLTAIKGFLSLILEGSYGKVSPELQEVLNKVYASNERIVQLVENLLNISRIESGRIQYQFEKSPIETLLKELSDMFFVMAKNKKLTLTFTLPKKKLPLIYMDSAKVREVISNLIDNAFKYTAEGGIEVILEQRGPVARITVADTGMGVEPETIPHLFSKFIRGSKEASRMNVAGTGLGLYVGRSFIEAHHGKIWIESEGKGKGSRFIIELPIVGE